MFGVGSGEIVLILVIAMLVVGPERMVTFARDAGVMLAKFRRETDSVTSEFKEAFSLEPTSDEADQESSTAPVPDDTPSAFESAPEPPPPSIAPVASAFADSEVTRVSVTPHAVTEAGPDVSETTTVLAMPEEESADQVDVYELTVIEGPEIMDDESTEISPGSAQSEGNQA